MHISEEKIITAIDLLINNHARQLALADGNGADMWAFDALKETIRTNRCTYMNGKCGQMQQLLQKYFSEDYPEFEIVSVTAHAENGVYHCYNLIIDQAGEIFIVDGSAAQFFTRPLDTFNGRPYYVGTRAHLKACVAQALKNTVSVLNASTDNNAQQFLALNHWQVDVSDFDCIKNAPISCLNTEKLTDGWYITWGDISHVDGSEPPRNPAQWTSELFTKPAPKKPFWMFWQP